MGALMCGAWCGVLAVRLVQVVVVAWVASVVAAQGVYDDEQLSGFECAAMSWYTSLKTMTACDAAIFDAQFARVASKSARAERLVAAVAALRGINIGTPVDLLEHAVQTAELAWAAGESTEVVAAGLLHDVAEVDVPVAHGEVGAALLRPYVRAGTTWCVEHHEVFQYAHYAHAYGVNASQARAPVDRLVASARRAWGQDVEDWADLCWRFTDYDQAAFDGSKNAAQRLNQSAGARAVRAVAARPEYYWLPTSSSGHHVHHITSQAKRDLLSAYPGSAAVDPLQALPAADESPPPAPWQTSSRGAAPRSGVVRFRESDLVRDGDLASVLAALLEDGLVLVDEVASPLALTERLFAPQTVSPTGFWDEGAVSCDAHMLNHTNAPSRDTDTGYYIADGIRHLPLHTDGTYIRDRPRVKVLATIHHDPSKELCVNTFLDGLQALASLEDTDLDLLRAQPVQFTVRMKPHAPILNWNRPLLDRDGDGRPTFAWNHQQANGPVINSTGYLKLKAFIDDEQRNALKTTLWPGTVALIDNWRVLHGRTTVNGNRTIHVADLHDRIFRKRWRKLRQHPA